MVCTPSTLPTAPSTARWQFSHEMEGATRVVDSIIVSLSFAFDLRYLSSVNFFNKMRCVAHARKRLNRSELLTTVTDEKAIAAAAKIGACSLRNGISGERIAVGMSSVL